MFFNNGFSSSKILLFLVISGVLGSEKFHPKAFQNIQFDFDTVDMQVSSFSWIVVFAVVFEDILSNDKGIVTDKY